MTICSYRKNGLISEQTQPGEQTVTIHILPNISRSKDNQTMKFGQLIEYNNNTFLQKSCRKWGRETSSRSFFVFLKMFNMR